MQVLWASAVAVTEMIMADPVLVRGKRVAAVGCGLALDGIAAALAGGPHCSHAPDNVPMSQLDIWANSAVITGMRGRRVANTG